MTFQKELSKSGDNTEQGTFRSRNMPYDLLTSCDILAKSRKRRAPAEDLEMAPPFPSTTYEQTANNGQILAYPSCTASIRRRPHRVTTGLHQGSSLTQPAISGRSMLTRGRRLPENGAIGVVDRPT